MTFNDLSFFFSEFYLFLSILILLIFSLICYQTKEYFFNIKGTIFLYLNFIFISIIIYKYISINLNYKVFFCNSVLIQSPEVIQVKCIVLVLSYALLYICTNYLKKIKMSFFEYIVLYHSATVGCLIIISSNDLLILYISLEIVALSLYILCALNKTLENTTGALKYFIVGSFSSAVFVYGCSLLFLGTGHHNFNKINNFLIFFDNIHVLEIKQTIILGQLLIIASLLFKLAMAPFHTWVADVYETINTPTAFFISIIPKISVFFILCKLITDTLHNTFFYSYIIISISCIFSLFLGVMHTIIQKNLKRFLAYSSISHFGFITLGLIQENTINGVNASIIYLSTYLLMTFFFGVYLY